MTKKENQRKANNIIKLKEYILENEYVADIEDDIPFFFNLKKDEDGELILGSGSKVDHFNIGMTSKNLMKLIQKRGVFHIDGTYKISSHGYPLVAYGITDMQGHYHPIAFMLTSNESTADFVHFLKG
jgi:hypothetical protein